MEKRKLKVEMSTVVFKPLEKLVEDDNFKKMIEIVFDRIDYTSTIKLDFEDAWQSLVLRILEHQVLERYDPDKGYFSRYMWVIAKRHFWNMSKKAARTPSRIGGSIISELNLVGVPFTIRPSDSPALMDRVTEKALGEFEVRAILDYVEGIIANLSLPVKSAQGSPLSVIPFFRLLRFGLSKPALAEVYGVGPTTIYNWIRRIKREVNKSNMGQAIVT